MTESHRLSTPPSAPAEDRRPRSFEELAGVEVRLEEARFELKLAQEANARLEQEIRRLEQRLAARGAECAAFRSRLAERDRYVSAIHSSFAWKLVEGVRGLLGRRWSS